MKKTFFLSLLLFAVAVALPGVRAATVTVQLGQNFFSPSAVTIGVGGSVLFTNTAGQHNVLGYNPASEAFCGSTVRGPGPMCTVTFNSAGTYQYRCTPHSSGSGTTFSGMVGSVTVTNVAIPVPPSIVLTNPANGALLAAPALFVFGASATASNASVTNVSFFLDGVLAGRDVSAPYQLAVSNVVAGLRVLRASATDSRGLSSTSAPVSIRVVERPVLLTLHTNGFMQFSFNTVTGLNYVVQSSGGQITNWTSVVTNRAATTNQEFVETLDIGSIRFYRVLVQP